MFEGLQLLVHCISVHSISAGVDFKEYVTYTRHSMLHTLGTVSNSRPLGEGLELHMVCRYSCLYEALWWAKTQLTFCYYSFARVLSGWSWYP